MNKRVKIVATLGPAVEIRGGKKFGDDGYWAEKLDVEKSAAKIAELITEGANVFRFNFSHGDHSEQGERMATVRLAEELARQKVAFLLDTKGPEMRTELFADDVKEYSYTTGEQIRVATKQGIESTRDVIALNVAGALDIYDDVAVGQISRSVRKAALHGQYLLYRIVLPDLHAFFHFVTSPILKFFFASFI